MGDMSSPEAPRPHAGQPTPADVGVLAAPKPCGDCSLCCKILDIPELEKPGGVWCRHFAKGRGCGVHADRPQVCRGYQCTWTWTAPLDERWRPDRAGFLIHPNQEP